MFFHVISFHGQLQIDLHATKRLHSLNALIPDKPEWEWFLKENLPVSTFNKYGPCGDYLMASVYSEYEVRKFVFLYAYD